MRNELHQQATKVTVQQRNERYTVLPTLPAIPSSPFSLMLACASLHVASGEPFGEPKSL